MGELILNSTLLPPELSFVKRAAEGAVVMFCNCEEQILQDCIPHKQQLSKRKEG